MSELNGAPSPYTRCVEWLFAHLDDSETASPLQPTSGRTGPPQQPVTLPENWPSAPPPLNNADDLRNVLEWFRAERTRLDEYTGQRLRDIQDQHYQVLASHYQSEAVMVRREQDVNRELQFLAAQTEELQARARGLVEWEEALAAQTERLAALQGGSAVAGGQDELAALRQAVSDRRLSEAAARARFEASQSLVKERQAVWEKKQAELLARQAELERRCRELQKTEEALQRRITEMDEVEDRLLRAFDKDEKRTEIEARQEELNRRYRELQRGEEALRRRLAEIEEIEEELSRALQPSESRSPPPRPLGSGSECPAHMGEEG